MGLDKGGAKDATLRAMDDNGSSEELLDVKRLAEFLSVSPYSVRRWHRQGMGPPSFRVGGMIRYRRSEVEAWLEAQREVAL